jgi:hypothetical protein
MITVRKGADRGRSGAFWLDSRHTFSFADYHDPEHVRFGALRVLNEDWIRPDSGFDAHPHRDMEILTWVLEGELEHADSRGNRLRLRPGQAQLMRAGTGIVHSETNPSTEETLHLLQIWLLPDRRGLEPGHREIDVELVPGRFVPVATAHGRGGGLAIHQDASVYGLRLPAGESAAHDLAPGRRAWLQVTSGRGRVGGTTVEAGDGVAWVDEPVLHVEADADLEALAFDLA